jgi:hypothetical protein
MAAKEIATTMMSNHGMLVPLSGLFQKQADAFEKGKRPKLAIQLPPRHGKSWSAEDFAAWLAGKRSDLKTSRPF